MECGPGIKPENLVTRDFFTYYTNNKNNEIDFDIKKDLVDNIRLIGKDDDNLKKDLIEKKMSLDLSD